MPSPGATSYDVLRSTVSGSGYAVVATSVTATSYANGGLATGTTYYYVVQGANFYGTGATSAEAQATTVPPAPPTVAAVGGSSQITVSWAPALKAASYNALRSATSGSGYVAFTGSTGLAGTSVVNSGLPAGTTCYYVVEAVNAAGTSARSPQAAATTTPPAPTGPAWSSPSTTQINLSWDSAAGATSYKVKRATVSGGPYTTIASGNITRTYGDSALTPGTGYYYVASAVNAAGESPDSTQVAAVTRPAAPTLYTPAAGDHYLRPSWSPVPGATSYAVKRSPTNGGPYVMIATTTNTYYTDSGLTNGVTYYYVVAAANTAGEGPNSNQASGTPVAPCSCPWS